MVRCRCVQPGVPRFGGGLDGKGRQARIVTTDGAGLGSAGGTCNRAVFRSVRESGRARIHLSSGRSCAWNGRRSVPPGPQTHPNHRRQTMKSKVLIGCVALQLLILAFMAGQREWIRLTGRPVYFRSAPVDPRDVMRGDYVRLSYDISHVPRESWRGPFPPRSTNLDAMPRDTRVYASLQLQEGGVAQLVSLGLEQPHDGVYIRGRTEASTPGQINVRYGLEALFLEQGKGEELETRRNRNGIQVPLEMKAAVSPNGIAVLRDYRWCALGMGLNVEMTNSVRTNGQRELQLRGATVQLL